MGLINNYDCVEVWEHFKIPDDSVERQSPELTGGGVTADAEDSERLLSAA
jgi:hypothetical protein